MFQQFALFGACVHMRFPSLFNLNEKHIYAAAIQIGKTGILHGKGYVKEDMTWGGREPVYNYQKYGLFGSSVPTDLPAIMNKSEKDDMPV